MFHRMEEHIQPKTATSKIFFFSLVSVCLRNAHKLCQGSICLDELGGLNSSGPHSEYVPLTVAVNLITK